MHVSPWNSQRYGTNRKCEHLEEKLISMHAPSNPGRLDRHSTLELFVPLLGHHQLLHLNLFECPVNPRGWSAGWVMALDDRCGL